ncbi:MAG TPA: hypothetical protein VGN14_11870 [Candidatus Elarobacter sp.]
MNARPSALIVGAIAIALVVAQDVSPRTPLYHSWQYALALAIALALLVAAMRGAGRRALLGYGGAAIVVVAGLAAGLLGPDTAEVVGTPGTVAPIPALGAAAFFAGVGAPSIARGDASVTLRRRDGASLALGTTPRPLGESVVFLAPRPAAFVEAWDARGAHLTVTQPANASFLSAVLLFRQHQRIRQFDVPVDTVATPAQHRVFHVLYFSPADAAALQPGIGGSEPAAIVTADDDAGTTIGITLARSGHDVALAGVRLRVTLGTYPALEVASAPPLWALALGITLYLAGVAWSLWPPRNARAAAQPQGA